MRTSERHHLKENELAIALRRAGELTARHQRALTIGAVLIGVVILAAASYFMWRNNRESRARELLAQAMVVDEARVLAPTPGAKPEDQPTQQPGTYPTERARLDAARPKFIAAADAYPATDAGRTARYHAALTLVALGRFDEAIKQYGQVMEGGGLLGQGAGLGRAEAQLRAGQHDAAIASFKELSERTDTNLPKEGILLALARAYKEAGKTEDARKTLNQIVEQHADSPIATQAKQELEKIKG